jgi:hypothetical protein
MNDSAEGASAKAILFCTSYFRDRAEWRNRYARWLDYYQRVGIEGARLFIIDDCSPYTPDADEIACVSSDCEIPRSDTEPLIVRFGNRLGRPARLSYPGWWRSFLHSANIARAIGADKIIHVESDAFILSPRLLDHIAELRTGWTTFWCPHHGLPETAIQVICQDQFAKMDWLQVRAQHGLDGLLAEHILPFTSINRALVGDRYSEIRRHRGIFRSHKFDWFPLFQTPFFGGIPRDADFATQVTPSQKLRSRICRDPGPAQGRGRSG